MLLLTHSTDEQVQIQKPNLQYWKVRGNAMKYEKLSKQALGCMYTATAAGTVAALAVIGAVYYFWLLPNDIEIGKLVAVLLGAVTLADGVTGPYFRYHRYGYCINEECIDIREGYLFVKRNIVPIERLHKLQIAKGPIDQIFKVAKVVVTTAGRDVTIRFLDEKKAEKIAESLRNEIVAEQKTEEEA